MKVFEHSTMASEAVDAANFTGGGTLVRMGGVCPSPLANAYHVTFDPGARTAWHTHTGSQLLIIVAGRCRFQKAGEPVREVGVGDIVSIEPNERHWHGASADAPTTHVAVNIEAETTWLGKVSDAEYAGRI